MDYIIFNQPGGFPLTTNILQYLQEFCQFRINDLAKMAGDKAILSGCNESGNKITSGAIIVDGEMYGLMEGIKQEYITIKEEREKVEFENGNNNDTIIYRYAVFGRGANSYKWSDFARVMPLRNVEGFIHAKANEIYELVNRHYSYFEDKIIELRNAHDARLKALEQEAANISKMTKPIWGQGGCYLWTGDRNSVPAGFKVLDEFDNKMLRGSKYNGWSEAGSDTQELSEHHLPPHFHYYKDVCHMEKSSQSGRPISGTIDFGSESYVGSHSTDSDNRYGYYRTDHTDYAGNGGSFSVIPAYRTVLLIKWVGIGNGTNG